MTADWMARAACAKPGMADLFFPEGKGDGHGLYGPARKVCAVCDVKAECLELALSFETGGHRQGMWGGLSPVERDRLRVRVRFCECGARITQPLARYCSDHCREVARIATKDRYREKVR